MPDLSFQMAGAESLPYAASPTIVFKVNVKNADPAEHIESVMLRAQIRIETKLRPYDARAEEHLLELFGPRPMWSTTQRSMLWAQVTAAVPRFVGETMADLPVTCTYDFNVASAKYFHGLEHGHVPLLFLFSGTVFYRDGQGALQISLISWVNEASWRMPVATWKETMEHYFPNSAWLRLRKDVFDRLYRYKAQRTLPTWEAALEELLQRQEAEVPT
jgi:hypothetical protein